MVESLVIIGSGPAGCAAALYAARADLKPLVIEGGEPGGQLTTTTTIENYPGFPDGVDGTDLVARMRRQAERFGARVQAGVVASVEFRAAPFRLTLDDAAVLESRAVIVATGASALYLGLESERRLIGRGVSGCATCDGALYRNKTVAVVGGGDTAMEDALFLTRFAARVVVIHRRDAFRASRIMAERVRRHPKIEIVWNTVIEDVLDSGHGDVAGLRLKHVQTGERTERAVDGLFVAIGHRPNTRPFAGQLALDENGYIVTQGVRTSVPGVFAAGDVQDHVYRQAVTAAGSGCMAAIEAERFLGQ